LLFFHFIRKPQKTIFTGKTFKIFSFSKLFRLALRYFCMAHLVATIHEDMKEAMRSGDAFRRDTLRFLESALKNAAIEKRVSLSEFSDEEVYAVLRRSVKQREESALQYRTGGRTELADKEEKERALLASYLPATPDEKSVREAVARAIAETGATTLKDMGQVMGFVMKSLPNAPGSDVRRIVEERLHAE
jgi:hypothetical protein